MKNYTTHKDYTTTHKDDTPWLKSKGYLHLTRSIDVNKQRNKIIALMGNKTFISKYAFYPLIYTGIKERKYKKGNPQKQVLKGGKARAHKFQDIKTREIKPTAKNRPLHYATHFDSLIYAYYASLLQKNYETKIAEVPELSACITAYRKLKINPELDDSIKGNGKSTIHFAKEIFEEIATRAKTEDISVLAFDIKSFFSSLDHDKLKEAWEDVMDFPSIELYPDHQNVFKATTKFNYVLLDSLRVGKTKGKKEGFDEKKLHEIRKTKGFKSFFSSNIELRNAIKSKELKVFANPFKKKGGKVMGIPQGLPISAILANIYLFKFDKFIFKNLVEDNSCYYRRYSDDIIIICNSKKTNFVQELIEEQMKISEVEISTDKTEKFDFRDEVYNNEKQVRLTSFKYDKESDTYKIAPLVYLGFEYRGYNTLIKSANIDKFYRRMILIVKRRARRVEILLDKNPDTNKAIFINQIKKLYKIKPKDKHVNKVDKVPNNKARKFLKENDKGEFYFVEGRQSSNPRKRSNYFSYLNRAEKIMNNSDIKRQLRKSKHILWSSINKHLKKI